MEEKIVIAFDLESTGVNVSVDRIVQIHAEIYKDIDNNLISESTYGCLVDPCDDSFKDSEGMKLNKLDWDLIKQSKAFSAISTEILALLNRADYFIGFNLNYDMNLLATEFLRCGYVLSDLIFLGKPRLDLFKLWKIHRRFRLQDAIKEFLKEEVSEEYHNAEYDTQKTVELVPKMFQAFEIEKTLFDIAIELDVEKIIDPTGFLIKRDGKLLFAKGKYKDKEVVEISKKDRGYLIWLSNSDASSIVLKNILSHFLK